jgi:hypothetical protein
MHNARQQASGWLPSWCETSRRFVFALGRVPNESRMSLEVDLREAYRSQIVAQAIGN